MQTWTIWTLDVWGNARDGYNVNDRCKSGKIELPDDADDRAVVKALKADGWIKAGIHFSSIEIDGDDYGMHVSQARDNRPIYQLERDGEAS